MLLELINACLPQKTRPRVYNLAKCYGTILSGMRMVDDVGPHCTCNLCQRQGASAIVEAMPLLLQDDDT